MVERLGPQERLEVIKFWIEQGKRFLDNFTLEGPINVPTMFGIFATLSPVNREFTILEIGQAEGHSRQMEVYDRILALTIPRRIRRAGIPRNEALRRQSEAVIRMLGVPAPSIFLAFGETERAKEKVTVL